MQLLEKFNLQYCKYTVLISTNFVIRNIYFYLHLHISICLSIHSSICKWSTQGVCNFRKKVIERFRNHWEHPTFSVQARTRPGAGPECHGSSDNRGSDFILSVLKQSLLNQAPNQVHWSLFQYWKNGECESTPVSTTTPAPTSMPSPLLRTRVGNMHNTCVLDCALHRSRIHTCLLQYCILSNVWLLIFSK